MHGLLQLQANTHTHTIFLTHKGDPHLLPRKSAGTEGLSCAKSGCVMYLLCQCSKWSCCVLAPYFVFIRGRLVSLQAGRAWVEQDRVNHCPISHLIRQQGGHVLKHNLRYRFRCTHLEWKRNVTRMKGAGAEMALKRLNIESIDESHVISQQTQIEEHNQRGHTHALQSKSVSYHTGTNHCLMHAGNASKTVHLASPGKQHCSSPFHTFILCPAKSHFGSGIRVPSSFSVISTSLLLCTIPTAWEWTSWACTTYECSRM